MVRLMFAMMTLTPGRLNERPADFFQEVGRHIGRPERKDVL